MTKGQKRQKSLEGIIDTKIQKYRDSRVDFLLTEM